MGSATATKRFYELCNLGLVNAAMLKLQQLMRKEIGEISATATKRFYELCNVGLVNAATLKLMEVEHTHLCGSNYATLDISRKNCLIKNLAKSEEKWSALQQRKQRA